MARSPQINKRYFFLSAFMASSRCMAQSSIARVATLRTNYHEDFERKLLPLNHGHSIVSKGERTPAEFFRSPRMM
jgi:hypothetical protein